MSDTISMPEVPIPKKPITALRRCESSLEQVERRLAELEADLSVINLVIERLERMADLVRTHEERRDREREAHVRDELFNYDLSRPGEDE